MELTPGAKLGAYEVESPLVAGGIGEVYRATHTKLGRDLALKVLPAEMAPTPTASLGYIARPVSSRHSTIRMW